MVAQQGGVPVLALALFLAPFTDALACRPYVYTTPAIGTDQDPLLWPRPRSMALLPPSNGVRQGVGIDASEFNFTLAEGTELTPTLEAAFTRYFNITFPNSRRRSSSSSKRGGTGTSRGKICRGSVNLLTALEVGVATPQAEQLLDLAPREGDDESYGLDVPDTGMLACLSV